MNNAQKALACPLLRGPRGGKLRGKKRPEASEVKDWLVADGMEHKRAVYIVAWLIMYGRVR